ncbi:hypothetical protein U1Q18_037510, partial [Sarracenia purpurea var. burkii]
YTYAHSNDRARADAASMAKIAEIATAIVQQTLDSAVAAWLYSLPLYSYFNNSMSQFHENFPSAEIEAPRSC